jgi:hypothetical protein
VVRRVYTGVTQAVYAVSIRMMLSVKPKVELPSEMDRIRAKEIVKSERRLSAN